MGQHTSARSGAGRFGWRRAVIAGVSVGVAFGTVGVVGLASGTTTPTPSVYSAVAPVTVLGRSLAANSNTDVTVAGVDSVPSNATSVQLSITALDGTATSSAYVYPTGATKPTSANVRWATGETVTIPVTVAVGTSGKIRLTTDSGTVTIKVAVVGYFSPASAPSGAGYAQTSSFAALDSAGAVVASVDVPAGSYEIQAKIVALYVGPTSPDHVGCEVDDPKSNQLDSATADVSTDLQEETLSIVGLDTTSGGTFSLDCYDYESDTNAYNISLVAVQLSSATGSVAGS
jgi:hypothetical protein